MPLILGTNSIKDTTFTVANSCRFDDSSSTRLQRTISSGSSSNTKFTISFWFKMCHNHTNDEWFFENYNSGSARTWIRFNLDTGDPRLEVSEYTGSYIFRKITHRVFRDIGAFYHIHVKFDSTQSTDTERLKIYINGVLETNFAQTNHPSLNATSIVANTGNQHIAYSENIGGAYFSGYMCEYVFLEGVAVEPNGNTGEFDTDSPNIWKPVDVSGLTFGTNGFYLDFEDSSALGNDANGSNNFTVTNLTAESQSLDTCTNNFATMNPLDKTPIGTSITYSDGNLTTTASSGSDWTQRYSLSNFVVSSGKWYVECKVGNIGTNQWYVGVIKNRQSATFSSSLGFLPNGVGYGHYAADGRIINNGSDLSSGSSFTTNDIIGIALDLDNGTLNFYKNGSANGSQVTSLDTTADWQFVGNSYSTAAWNWNFGSPAFSISSGNADANSHGNFEYAVPSGYFSLCTKNLSEHGWWLIQI